MFVSEFFFDKPDSTSLYEGSTSIRLIQKTFLGANTLAYLATAKLDQHSSLFFRTGEEGEAISSATLGQCHKTFFSSEIIQKFFETLATGAVFTTPSFRPNIQMAE